MYVCMYGYQPEDQLDPISVTFREAHMHMYLYALYTLHGGITNSTEKAY